jgi:histidinol phosphatase-like PHP family hydrolase/predicted nuclease with RNAse H fold/dephospho-CoA kinase
MKRKGTNVAGVRAVQSTLDQDYFRTRDFEYVQPLYDLAFHLEVAALAAGSEVPKYRTFSLWRAGYSMDGYGTSVDRWLEGNAPDSALDYVPSSRIRQYLESIRTTGSLPELRSYSGERHQRALRLRAVRGLGPSKIAVTLGSKSFDDDWFNEVAMEIALDRNRIAQLYAADNPGPWQTAHVIPPLLRFLRSIEKAAGRPLRWHVPDVADPFEPITHTILVHTDTPMTELRSSLKAALRNERHFRRHDKNGGGDAFRHQLGWVFYVAGESDTAGYDLRSVEQLAVALDPLSKPLDTSLRSDLHLHTSWSDGSATVEAMAKAIVSSGLTFFAVTDHSRSSKLQGGLTPPLWLKQANALALATPMCPVVHGIEVDILRDGRLDLPPAILGAAGFVVASVHSSWTRDARQNTDRMLRAVESGCIDVIAHPTSALIGKPGVPDYVRQPADVYWEEVFDACARWHVALEFNCFPSRLDLPPALLREAAGRGCAISLGSDSHARSHLIHLRYGAEALRHVNADVVLNRFGLNDFKSWIRASRSAREPLSRRPRELVQAELQFDSEPVCRSVQLSARTQPPHLVPEGSSVVGIDLTAGDKATGVAILNGRAVYACSLKSDDDILKYVAEQRPAIVSIDSPLGLPGGGEVIRRSAGIVRVAEQDLASIGIPAYPALIDSMKELTLRGIRLRKALEANGVQVIESYPGAAQDILCLPRKQKGLGLLRDGLRRLGLDGPGLETKSHDEMDAITAAVVGRYFEVGSFEPMGIVSEAQLIVPKTSPLSFDHAPVVCLAGKTGAGKSVVARYLSVFYGFVWLKTRDVIQELLLEDLRKPQERRWLRREVDPANITERDLREFGGIVLTELKQDPLRSRLSTKVFQSTTAVVVDSIRDLVDVDRARLRDRPVMVWYIDCSDGVICERLSRRLKLGQRRIPTASPVDRTADALRAQATVCISNSSTLEDLRWRIDDSLFELTEVRTSGEQIGAVTVDGLARISR